MCTYQTTCQKRLGQDRADVHFGSIKDTVAACQLVQNFLNDLAVLWAISEHPSLSEGQQKTIVMGGGERNERETFTFAHFKLDTHSQMQPPTQGRVNNNATHTLPCALLDSTRGVVGNVGEPIQIIAPIPRQTLCGTRSPQFLGKWRQVCDVQ